MVSDIDWQNEALRKERDGRYLPGMTKKDTEVAGHDVIQHVTCFLVYASRVSQLNADHHVSESTLLSIDQ